MSKTYSKFCYVIREPNKSWRTYATGISDVDTLDADLHGLVAELAEETVRPPFRVVIYGVEECDLADFTVSDVNDLVTKRATERF